jgi:hypothetical protein
MTNEARRQREAQWRRDGEKCARCGLARINVVHERDPEHAPEGIAYYREFWDQLHEFVPTR